MENDWFEYKGYTIVPMPVTDDGELWYGGYEIMKDGKMVSERDRIFPCFLYYAAAHNDSIGHAKMEIENLTSS